MLSKSPWETFLFRAANAGYRSNLPTRRKGMARGNPAESSHYQEPTPPSLSHGQLPDSEGAHGQGKLRRNAGEGATHHGESSTGLSPNGLRSKRPGFPRAAQRSPR